MAKRLDELTRLLKNEPNDPFLLYGIAMEHKKAGDLDEALAWFDKTLAAEATYCYAYYQKGQVFEAKGDTEAAAAVYREGMKQAESCNDLHARDEMSVALEALE